MNLLLLFEEDRIGGDHFLVRGSRAEHAKSVLGVTVGQILKVGLLNGPLGTATVESVDAPNAEVMAEPAIGLDVRFGPLVAARPRTDLILALPRPKSLKKLLPEISAFGVDRLVLLRTWRVDKSYLKSPLLRAERYRPLLFAGLMQARATAEVVVELEPRFRPFVEDRAPTLAKRARAFVLHPGASQKMATEAISPADRVVLAIGPEGGLLPYEVEAFERAGFVALSISERVLRVETATISALGQIELLRAQWR